VFDRHAQGFDDTLNGVDIVTDPATGATFEAPYRERIPDGLGYHDPAGNQLTVPDP